jgi:transposase-like protein
MAQETTNKAYSEAFKRQVVQEHEAGSSISQLQRKYQIGGKMTVQRWIRRYSHQGQSEGVAALTAAAAAPAMSETGSAERIAWLEKAVADLTVEKLLLQSTLEAYQATYGLEVAKKTGCPSSSKPTSKAKAK